MEQLLSSHSAVLRHTSFLHHYAGDVLTFESKLWDYFRREQIEERILAWRKAVDGVNFRVPTDIETDETGALSTRMSPLPEGFIPLSQHARMDMGAAARVRILVNTCLALAKLHSKAFHLGFLSPELIYVHPESLDVILDIQPYPTTLPFVNQVNRAFPFRLFSRYTRFLDMPRIADYHALGLLLHWMHFGEFPRFFEHRAEEMPLAYRATCARLLERPHEFVTVEEIAHALCEGLPGMEMPITFPVSGADKNWLHPVELPIDPRSQTLIRRFMRAKGVGCIAVISPDETARTDVVRAHMNEVLEEDMFISIHCQNYPFAALRQILERITANAIRYMPGSIANRLHLVGRRFEALLHRHFEGDDVVSALADWVYELHQQTQPFYEAMRVYFLIDNCDQFDEDSLRVSLHFWQKYAEQTIHHGNGLHVIFSGKSLPSVIPQGLFPVLQAGGDAPELYERLISSALGRVDAPLLTWLVQEFSSRALSFTSIRVVLERLVENADIQYGTDGWTFRAGRPHIHFPSADSLLGARFAALDSADQQLLTVFSCLPVPIRAFALFEANEIPTEGFVATLVRLSRLGLLHVYHENSVYVPAEVSRLVLSRQGRQDQAAVYQKALVLQGKFEPTVLAPLLELARQAGDTRSEYYLMIQYFRQNRSLLSFANKMGMLDAIWRLQRALGRDKITCWERKRVEIYSRVNDFERGEEASHRLFERTGLVRDKFTWNLYQMFNGTIELEPLRLELEVFMANVENHLPDRVKAAWLYARINFYLPLNRTGAEVLDGFYKDVVKPNRERLSVRQFAEMTTAYTILIIQYFPEKEPEVTVLLELLESKLENSQHRAMMSSVYEAYSFHSNVAICRRYNLRTLEMARRSGAHTKEQVCHLNGMELSLYQGDLAGYRFHKQQALHVDKIRRKDLVEEFWVHHLMQGCEWMEWDVFDVAKQVLANNEVSQSTSSLFQVYHAYAQFRRGQAVQASLASIGRNQFTCFVEGLTALQNGHRKQACGRFEETILTNGFHMTAGWSYRELIQILVDDGNARAEWWLSQFEGYLKQFACDVFWPDFYRLSALWAQHTGDLQDAILHMRRAVNGYQLVEKADERTKAAAALASMTKPAYLVPNAPVLNDASAQMLLRDREDFLEQSLDFLVIIQLSQQVSESLDLSSTCQRLTDALFEYFPVTQTAIHFRLSHRTETVLYTAAGQVDEDARTEDDRQGEETIAFSLYSQNDQWVKMDIRIQQADERKVRHMMDFLRVVKPHIANAIHYMEMMTDNLTGFYQRRYFVEKLQAELDLAQTYSLDLSLIMMDLDNFRKINEYGHPEGDKVLREVADIVRDVLRKNDIPGRYGGEELLLILPKTDGSEAMGVATRLRHAIEEHFCDGRPYRVTVSVGVASRLRCQVEQVDELISMADTAEIHAKNTGKNKVVAAWHLE